MDSERCPQQSVHSENSTSHFVAGAMTCAPEAPYPPSAPAQGEDAGLGLAGNIRSGLGAGGAQAEGCILVAEEDEDTRYYLHRILSVQWRVRLVKDGLSALDALRSDPPVLVMAGRTMPGMDGLELLRHIRAGADTRLIPVILLCGPMGEEAKAEGFLCGADDYLIKPFGAGDLLAKASAHIQLGPTHQEALASLNSLLEQTRQSEQRLLALMAATSDVIFRMSPGWKTMTALYGHGFLLDTERPDPNWLQRYIPPDEQARVTAAVEGCIRDRKMIMLEHRVFAIDGSTAWAYSRVVPLLDPNGGIKEWLGAASDITRRKEAELAMRRDEERKAFFLELSNAARPLQGAKAMHETLSVMLIAYMKASYCNIVDIGPGNVAILENGVLQTNGCDEYSGLPTPSPSCVRARTSSARMRLMTPGPRRRCAAC